MKKHTIRLILPVTIIAFAFFTKWWYVIPDGPHVIAYGFPFIYKCPGFHTSLSIQYFISEMIADFIFYFLACSTLIFIISKWVRLHISRTVSILLWVIASVGILYTEFEIVFLENMFLIKRDFEVEVMETGLSTPFNVESGSYKYHPQKK